MTAPTDDELARCRRWAAMQDRPVTCLNGFTGFWLHPLPEIIGSHTDARGSYPNPDAAWSALAIALRPIFASVAPVLFEEAAKVMEEFAAKLDLFAVTTEQRVGIEPEREKYLLTYAQADKNMAVEFRDLSLTLRESIRRLSPKEPT